MVEFNVDVELRGLWFTCTGRYYPAVPASQWEDKDDEEFYFESIHLGEHEVTEIISDEVLGFLEELCIADLKGANRGGSNALAKRLQSLSER